MQESHATAYLPTFPSSRFVSGSGPAEAVLQGPTAGPNEEGPVSSKHAGQDHIACPQHEDTFFGRLPQDGRRRNGQSGLHSPDPQLT